MYLRKLKSMFYFGLVFFSPLNEPVPCSTGLGFLGSSQVYPKHKCKPVCWLLFSFFFFLLLRSRVICAISRERVRNRSRGRWGGSSDHIPTSPHQLKPLLSAGMGEWHQHPQLPRSKADRAILLLMSHLYGEMSTGAFSHPNSCLAV